jgi:hypothetical protein
LESWSYSEDRKVGPNRIVELQWKVELRREWKSGRFVDLLLLPQVIFVGERSCLYSPHSPFVKAGNGREKIYKK